MRPVRLSTENEGYRALHRRSENSFSESDLKAKLTEAGGGGGGGGQSACDVEGRIDGCLGRRLHPHSRANRVWKELESSASAPMLSPPHT